MKVRFIFNDSLIRIGSLPIEDQKAFEELGIRGVTYASEASSTYNGAIELIRNGYTMISKEDIKSLLDELSINYKFESDSKKKNRDEVSRMGSAINLVLSPFSSERHHISFREPGPDKIDEEGIWAFFHKGGLPKLRVDLIKGLRKNGHLLK